ncbi:MAG: hypothetical protein LAT62_14915, partial [Natronospirillum sp.]|uniref:hypothetical protein n=1 Tax=Natronospirillum sp. TaxID=2812955 RepID=UPI0025EA0A62
MWRTDTSVASRGSSSAGKLSGEERKAFHKGQFFTPDAAAQLMWRIASRAMTGERSYSVADFSVGSGQLIQYCQPQTHTLFLADVDQSNLDSLRKDLSRAGFDYNLSYKGMQSVRASGLNVGLLNPPFNLDLRDDRLNADYASVSVNKALGNKSAPSQRYAVEQALDACEVVVALLPITDITALYNGHWKPNGVERLCGLVTLPRDLFAAEKTLVSTGLAVFGRTGQDVGPGWFEYSAFCPYDLVGDFSLVSAKPEFAEISKSRLPVATMPATGIKAVTLTRKGRRIVPAFQCGQVEEQVLGAILRAPVHEFQNQQSSLRTHYARTTQYIGQGQLDIEAWLRGPGISEAMANLESVVRNAGGEPTWAPGLVAYLQKRERQHKVASTATRHWTYYPAPVTDTPPTATVRKIFPLDPAALLTPTLDKGAQVTAVASAGGYKITLADGSSHEVAPERFAEHFCFDEPDGHQESSRGGEWTLSAEGRPAHFPEQVAAIQGEAVKRGV